MSSDISKAEFLKRYLEDDKDKEKKRKKKRKSIISGLKIVHVDIDIKAIPFGEKADEEVGDDAPVIAEVIDERPLEAQLEEQYEKSKWKKLTYGENSESQQGFSDSQNSRLKSAEINSDSNISPSRSMCAKKKTLSSVRSRTSASKKHQQKARHDSSSDNSQLEVPHQKIKKEKTSDCDYSPPRNREQRSIRHDSDYDYSPPRNYKNDDQKQKRHDSDSDLSPVRKEDYSMIDYSQEKGSNRSGDKKRFSPLRGSMSQVKNDAHRKKRHDSDSDFSPDRIRSRASPIQEQKLKKTSVNRRDSDSDFSPPRPSWSQEKSPSDEKSRPMKTLSGLKAGLQNAATLKQETQELRERERKQINKLHDDISGRNAETIIRDRKTGKKRDIEAENRVKEEKESKKAEQQEKYSKWGKGIEQEEIRKNKISEDLYEVSKPLARYQNDEDLEEMLKSVIYDDDPMSAYMKKKKQKTAGPSMPVYSGPPPPPNRFGIQPGYRWDGVDRSNGFEKKYFEKHNSSKAIQEEAYLWSVQNM